MQKNIKYILFIIFIILTNKGYAQSMYVNKAYTEMQALNFTTRYAAELNRGSAVKNIENNTRKISENFTKILIAKEIAYKSLYEVHALLKDGLQVKYLFTLTEDVSRELKNLVYELKDYPEGSVFLKEYIIEILAITNSIISEGQSVITKDKKMLLSHYERDEIIQNLIHKLKLLASSLELTKVAIQNTKMLGFWKTLNPFKNYINEDKMIMQDIIRKYNNIK